MSKVDELVRGQSIVFMLELLLGRLREAFEEEKAKLLEEEREECDRSFGEWLESDGSGDEVVPTVIKMYDAVKAVPIPGDESILSHRFEKSGEMTVTVSIKKRSFEVEVLKSLQVSLGNLSHPILHWAIERAAIRGSVDDEAKRFLNKLSAVLRKGAQADTYFQPLSQWGKMRPASPEYCEVVWRLIRSAQIEGGPAPSQGQIGWLSEELELKKELPGQDHNNLFEFLRAGRLPKSKKLDAFTNAFNRYLYNKQIDEGTYRTGLSRANKAIEEAGGVPALPDRDVLEAQIADISKLFVDGLLGLKVIATASQIENSSLKWREKSLEEGLIDLLEDQTH